MGGLLCLSRHVRHVLEQLVNGVFKPDRDPSGAIQDTGVDPWRGDVFLGRHTRKMMRSLLRHMLAHAGHEVEIWEDVTATRDPAVTDALKRIDVTCILHKPLREEELMEALRQALEGQSG